MNRASPVRLSLRNRLLVILAILVAIFSIVLFVSIQHLLAGLWRNTGRPPQGSSCQHSGKSQDRDGALFLIFRMTFTILGSIGEDRIFYRIDANSTFLTG